MPLYQYDAINEKGKKYRATLDADSLQDAKLKLIKRQIPVLQVESIEGKKLKNSLSKSELLGLTQELARLLQAGLPLYETLSALEEKYRKQKAHSLLLSLSDLVKSGLSFSTALSRHPETFDLLYISMVANAEKTGRLAKALQELGDLIDRQLKVKKQILSALLYPALLTGFCLIVLSSLLFYVIPSLRELFEGRELHPFTSLVFAASSLACKGKWILLFVLLSFLSFLSATLYSPRLKEKMYKILCKAPFFKSLFLKVAFVRFSRASATLLEGGLPLIQAFSQARHVMGHPLLEEVIRRAEERISQGEPVHAPFQNHPMVPPLISRMLGIAEEGGKLPFMLDQIARIYEDELEKTLTHFATVAQPLLLLILGGIIGFVLLSVLLPMTDVSSFTT
jgi:general secretion pathway protein F/type IV pilus assembly protein PilC